MSTLGNKKITTKPAFGFDAVIRAAAVLGSIVARYAVRETVALALMRPVEADLIPFDRREF